MTRFWIRTAGGLLFALLVAGVFLAVEAWRSANRHKANRLNLKQIMGAMHAYHDKCQCFPPAYFVDASGKPAHSWRLMLLPFLGRGDLYSMYRFDEPWDGPNNRALLREMPEAYQWPWGQANGETCYKALLGSQTAFPGHVSTCMDDFRDGTSNSIMVVESMGGVPWTAPTDVVFIELKNDYRLFHRSGLFSDDWFAAGMGDGSVKSMTSRLDPRIFYMYCTIASGRRHPGLLGKSLPFEATVQEVEQWDDRPLKATDLWPTMQWPLVPDRNFVYCATMQIGLQNRAREKKLAAGLIVGSTPLAKALAGDRFVESNLDPATYVAETGLNSPELDARIRKALSEKFPGSAFPYISPRGHIYSFSYLQKRLPFATAFEKAKTPLAFKHAGVATAVMAFGCLDPEILPARELVRVASFEREGDFILTLATDSPRRDLITLARIAPRPTLAETWREAEKRLASRLNGEMAALRDVDKLLVPKINLSMLRSYDELCQPTSSDSTLWEANQAVRFSLDERGAILESFADSVDGIGDESKPREFIFDRPFLLALTESGATQPYFAMWVANPEVMIPFAQVEAGKE